MRHRARTMLSKFGLPRSADWLINSDAFRFCSLDGHGLEFTRTRTRNQPPPIIDLGYGLVARKWVRSVYRTKSYPPKTPRRIA